MENLEKKKKREFRGVVVVQSGLWVKRSNVISIDTNLGKE